MKPILALFILGGIVGSTSAAEPDVVAVQPDPAIEATAAAPVLTDLVPAEIPPASPFHRTGLVDYTDPYGVENIGTFNYQYEDYGVDYDRNGYYKPALPKYKAWTKRR